MRQRKLGRYLHASRGALIAAIAGLCLSPVSSVAQPEESEHERVLFEADSVTRADKQSPIIAEGNVKAYYGERFLSAERVEYDPATDIVTAEGSVAITNEDGETYFSDRITLTGDLADGVARNFSAMLADDSRLASATVVKEGDRRNVLSRAVYSACDVCTDDGEEKTPSWQLKAVRVVQDKESNTIRFRHAYMEMFGVPMLYTPYFQIPDPSVERQSGLLTPSFGTTTTLGAYLEVPYYHVISDYQDITLRPKFMEQQGVLAQGEYRINNWRGGAVVQAGIIKANEDSEYFISNRPGRNTPGVRYHLFSAGEQRFAENWKASYDIEHVSDKRYLSVYDVERDGDLQISDRLFRPDRLSSIATVRRLTDDSLLSFSGLGFQSLRFSEDNDYAAQALPRIRYNKLLDTPLIGGDTEIDAELLALTRRDGLDSRHAIVSAEWQRRFTTSGGHRFRLFSELRGDLYSYDKLEEGNESCNPSILSDAAFSTCIQMFPGAASDGAQTTTRVLPTVGAEWSFPLAKRTENATFIVEPRVQLVVSPEQDYIEDIVNEDSQFFEFDTQTLFRPNKSVGYDLWEDGQRANVGLAATAMFDSGLTIDGAIGQQFRSEDSEVYSAYGLQAGLGDTSSDIVGSLDIDWRGRLALRNSLRFDREDGSIQRAASEISGRYRNFTANASYLKARSNGVTGASAGLDEFLNVAVSYKFAEKWYAGARAKRDVSQGENTQEILSLTYQDECMRVIFAYRNDPRRDLDFEFNRSFSIQVMLTGINQ